MFLSILNVIFVFILFYTGNFSLEHPPNIYFLIIWPWLKHIIFNSGAQYRCTYSFGFEIKKWSKNILAIRVRRVPKPFFFSSTKYMFVFSVFRWGIPERRSVNRYYYCYYYFSTRGEIRGYVYLRGARCLHANEDRVVTSTRRRRHRLPPRRPPSTPRRRFHHRRHRPSLAYRRIRAARIRTYAFRRFAGEDGRVNRPCTNRSDRPFDPSPQIYDVGVLAVVNCYGSTTASVP